MSGQKCALPRTESNLRITVRIWVTGLQLWLELGLRGGGESGGFLSGKLRGLLSMIHSPDRLTRFKGVISSLRGKESEGMEISPAFEGVDLWADVDRRMYRMCISRMDMPFGHFFLLCMCTSTGNCVVC